MADFHRAGTKGNVQEVVEAIRVLKRLEASGQPATEDDKARLARFTGFGAIATKVFPDPASGNYAAGFEDLGRELEELLTEDEYASAKATTYSAFYTSPVVMAEMYRALEKMGIKAGDRGLEPGCGIGGFVGAAPTGLEFIGIERDSVSGRIAKLLHPEQDIRIEPFQDSNLPEASVDFAVGNVPFADVKLRHRGVRHSLHDYFFLRSLESVRPGGVLALVTSRYTMDKINPKVRELLDDQADLVGAIRLPGEAFSDQGTSVVTDIVFLRKKPLDLGQEVDERVPEWSDKGWLATYTAEMEGGEANINSYFRRNPHMVLGEMSVGRGMYNGETLRVRSDGELAAALHAAVDGLPEGIVTERAMPLRAAKTLELASDLPSYLAEGSFYIAPDKTIMQVVDGTGQAVMQGDKPLKANGTPGGKRLGLLIELRDRARDVLKTQQDGQSEADRDAARGRLRQTYARFKAKFGPINKTTLSETKSGTVVRRTPNVQRFKSDPDVYLVMALEHYDERSGEAERASIMERDVVTAAEAISSVESAKDGLLACLNSLGCVDIPHIASLYGRSEDEVVKELDQLIFFDPALDAYVPADEYLSGKVRDKLAIAKACDDARAAGNVEALQKAQPEDLVAEEIEVSLGTPWIPAKDVRKFLIETLDRGVSVEYVQKEALWKVRPVSGARGDAAAISEYGTQDIDAYTLVEQALNMRTPTVRRAVPGGPGERDTYVVDQEATLAARGKQEALKRRFSTWVFEDPIRRERLVKFYNEHFNNIKLREFSGDHLTFPRMSSAIELRPHQKAAVWRNMSDGNTLFAHVVGAGKTFTMIAAAMEMKRTGLARKPAFIVPNHMLEQFSREFLVLYPDANILVATKQDLAKHRRQLLKARMATGDWDGIVMTHSSFEKMAMSPDFQAEFLSQEIREYEQMIEGALDRSLSANLTKRMEKLKDAREEKLKEMAEGNAKDGGLYFNELGIDCLFVDEAHLFKNLLTATKMDRVAGVQTGGSKRAYDLLMKARYLQSRTPGRGLNFATGTPVSNSLGELYTMMRYLMPDRLKERGIEHFDSWAAAFGEVVNLLEISPDGKSLRVNSRFAKFHNLPELLSIFRLTADVQTAGMLNLPVPALKGGKAEIVSAPMAEFGEEYQQKLVERYERVRSIKLDPRVDNVLKIITDGRKLALDPRLVSRNAEDDPGSKVNQLVDKVYEIWERTKADRSAQMIFSDMGVSETKWGFCVYDDVIEKLEARGVPREEIANIGDFDTDVKKEQLFSQVRSGRVRVLLGSTAKMGTGTNAQERLYALHHLDAPWRPADIEQREGRILRQGNTNKEVEIYRYVTEGSFDSYMWQTLETKAKFIAQAMAGDPGCRRADDIGGAELSFAEVKAIASGNPAMLVLAEMDMVIREMRLLRQAHGRDQARIATELRELPGSIEIYRERVARLEEDIARRTDTKGDAFVMRVGDRVFKPEKGEKKTARQRADAAIALAIAQLGTSFHEREIKLGEIGGFDIVLKSGFDTFTKSVEYNVSLEGADSYRVAYFQGDPKACPALVQALEQKLRSLDKSLAFSRGEAEKREANLEQYRARAGAVFPGEEVFGQLSPLRDRLEILLSKKDKKPEPAEPEVEEEERITLPEYLATLEADAEAGEQDAPEVVAESEPEQPEATELSTEDEIAQIVEQYRALTDDVEKARQAEAPQPVKTEEEAPAVDEVELVVTSEPTEPEAVAAAVEGLEQGEDADRTAAITDSEVEISASEPAIEAQQGLDQVDDVEPATETKPAEPKPDKRPLSEVLAEVSDSTLGDEDRVVTGAETPIAAPEVGDQAEVETSAPFAEDAIAIIGQEEDGISWFSLAVRDPSQGSWNIQSIYAQEGRRAGDEWRDDAWVAEHLPEDLDLQDLGQYLGDEEFGRLIPAQREVLGDAQEVAVSERELAIENPVEDEAPAIDDGVAIVRDDKATQRFFLAVTAPGIDSWRMTELQPPHREIGWAAEAYVLSHLASESDVLEQAHHLADHDREGLIPEQRAHLDRGQGDDVEHAPSIVIVREGGTTKIATKQPTGDGWYLEFLYPQSPSSALNKGRKGDGWRDSEWVSEHQLAELNAPMLDHISAEEREALIPEQRARFEELAGEASAVETPAPAVEPIEVSSRRPANQGHRPAGQIGLFDRPASIIPTQKPSPRVSEAISRAPVQTSLFDLFSTEDAPTPPPPAEIVATSYPASPFEVRGTFDPEFEWTEEDDELYRLEMEARGRLSKDDPLYIDPDPAAHDAEIELWQASLSGGEESDMQDMLENGGYAGAPEPTERAVLGSFTRMVGDRPGVAEIVHDAVEHYQPFERVVERVERETGDRGSFASAAEKRGARSLYNATLARRSGWESAAR